MGHASDVMDHKTPTHEASHSRHKARRSRLIAALLAAAVLGVGMVLWQLGRPAYRVHTSYAVGERRTSVVVAYPSDWSVDHRSDPIDADASAPTTTWMSLRRARPQGLQWWLEKYVYHISEEDYDSSFIFVELQAVRHFKGLNAETSRLQQAYSTMARPGGSYSILRRTCPIGPCLDIAFRPDTGPPFMNRPRRIGNVLLVFPTAAPGEPQYEVIVRYYIPPSSRDNDPLNDRLYKIASDVVSRLRLVREHGRPSP